MKFTMKRPEQSNRGRMIRSFEQMNKLPPPVGLREVREKLVDDQAFSWYEYIPASYDGSRPIPLVVQLHGGGNDGLRWANFTIWHLLAEREGFLVVYPNSPLPGAWTCGDEDIRYLKHLIEHLCGKYCVDASRIFMQGMSNGEMMTLAFAMRHPDMLAAAGFLTGPSPEDMIGEERPVGALPLYQMRGEKDVFFQLPDPLPADLYAKRYGMNDFNREIWLDANGVSKYPALTIQGKDNFLVFRGEKAPIINHEIQAMGHREPPDSAEMMWDLLYSRARRENGMPIANLSDALLAGDTDGVAIAVGSHLAYQGSQVKQLHPSPHAFTRIVQPPANEGHFNPVNIGEMLEVPGLYIPIEGLNTLFGATTELVNPGLSANAVFPDGSAYVFHADSILAMKNGRYLSLRKPCMLLSGVFFVPIDEIAGNLLGKHVSMSEGVMYIADHYALLGGYTARFLRNVLGGTGDA